VKKEGGTWRRRHCLSCGAVFTTHETALADNLFVVKKNKRRQRFMYEKTFISIFSALNTKKNNDNGTNAKLAKEITLSVIRKIIQEQKQGRIISTRLLIITIYKELKKRGRLFADHYIYYSEYRLQTALAEKLITLDK
jgi:transcriptional regulator NrdR family protein